MKMKRLYISLDILYNLLNEEKIYVREYKLKNEILDSTFKRSLSEVRCWISNYEYFNLYLYYDKKNKCYCLINTEKK